jgi:hypothetical protein
MKTRLIKFISFLALTSFITMGCEREYYAEERHERRERREHRHYRDYDHDWDHHEDHDLDNHDEH